MDRLLDTAPCGYVAFTDEGVIRMVNTTLATLLGSSVAELQGQKFGPARVERAFFITRIFPVRKLHGEAESLSHTSSSRGRDIRVSHWPGTNAIARW